jgi:hypothetical protein
MPWKKTGAGELEFEGKIVKWVSEIRGWYEADLELQKLTTWETCMVFAAALYAGLAKGKWGSEFLGKGKIEKLDSTLSTTKGGQISMNPFDVLDFLAKNLDENFLVSKSSYVRGEVKAMVMREAARKAGA